MREGNFVDGSGLQLTVGRALHLKKKGEKIYPGQSNKVL